MRYFLITAVLFFSTHLIAATAGPRALPVELHKRTALTVYIVPDMGTRFTFPFILDEQDSYVPFTLTPTNPAFENTREKGRNFFVITAPVGKGGSVSSSFYGNIFVSVAGYEISIELRTTNDLSKQYSDVVFNLTDDDRETLIQAGVAQRTKALESEYKKKMESIEFDTDQKAIARVGRLALTKPDSKGIKEENSLTLPNGDKVTLFVDESVIYEPYNIIVFDLSVDSSSKGVNIMDAKLFATNPDTKQSHVISVGKDIPGRVQADSTGKGAVTVLSTSINPKDLLRLEVLTDKGSVDASW